MKEEGLAGLGNWIPSCKEMRKERRQREGEGERERADSVRKRTGRGGGGGGSQKNTCLFAYGEQVAEGIHNIIKGHFRGEAHDAAQVRPNQAAILG